MADDTFRDRLQALAEEAQHELGGTSDPRAAIVSTALVTAAAVYGGMHSTDGPPPEPQPQAPAQSNQGAQEAGQVQQPPPPPPQQ